MGRFWGKSELARAQSHRQSMKPNARVAVRRRPSRLLIALAAIWMIVSLAIGGMVGAQSGTDSGTSTTITRTAQP